MYGLHPDKHYALGKLLAKGGAKKRAQEPSLLVSNLAQKLYEEQQKRALNGR